MLVGGETLRVTRRHFLPLGVEGRRRGRQPLEFGAVLGRLAHIFGQAALGRRQLIQTVGLAAQIALAGGNEARAAIAGLELRRGLAEVPGFDIGFRALHVGRQVLRWLRGCRLHGSGLGRRRLRRGRLCRRRLRGCRLRRRLLLATDHAQLGQGLIIGNTGRRQVVGLLIVLQRLLGAVAEIAVLADHPALRVARVRGPQLLLQQRHVRAFLAELDLAVGQRLLGRRRKLAGDVLDRRRFVDDVRRVGGTLVGGDRAAGHIAHVTIRLVQILRVGVDVEVGAVIARIALAVTRLDAQRLAVFDLDARLDAVVDLHVPQLEHHLAAGAVEDRHRAVALVDLADVAIGRRRHGHVAAVVVGVLQHDVLGHHQLPARGVYGGAAVVARHFFGLAVDLGVNAATFLQMVAGMMMFDVGPFGDRLGAAADAFDDLVSGHDCFS